LYSVTIAKWHGYLIWLQHPLPTGNMKQKYLKSLPKTIPFFFSFFLNRGGLDPLDPPPWIRAWLFSLDLVGKYIYKDKVDIGSVGKMCKTDISEIPTGIWNFPTIVALTNFGRGVRHPPHPPVATALLVSSFLLDSARKVWTRTKARIR
jgi:hypothetical protein